MATTVQAPAGARTPGTVTGPDVKLFRVGAIFGFVTTAIAVISNAAHPRDLFDLSTPDRLQRIADFGPWLIVHFGAVVAAALSIVTFVAVYRSIATGPSAWAWPALATALVSVSVALVSFVMDGFGLWGLAEAWVNASGPAKAGIVAAADGVGSFETALFIGATLMIFGATPIVGGVALWTDGSYPRWVAGAGIVAGATGVTAGAINFLAGEVTDFAFIVLFTIASVLLTVWFLALSVYLWRRSQATV